VILFDQLVGSQIANPVAPEASVDLVPTPALVAIPRGMAAGSTARGFR
jgi:hypothetical protein